MARKVLDRPKTNVILNTKEEKISRIIHVETYLTGMVTSNSNGYQPHTGDEDHVLRLEVKALRIELGIIRENSKVNKPPNSQTPPEGVNKIEKVDEEVRKDL